MNINTAISKLKILNDFDVHSQDCMQKLYCDINSFDEFVSMNQLAASIDYPLFERLVDCIKNFSKCDAVDIDLDECNFYVDDIRTGSWSSFRYRKVLTMNIWKKVYWLDNAFLIELETLLKKSKPSKPKMKDCYSYLEFFENMTFWKWCKNICQPFTINYRLADFKDLKQCPFKIRLFDFLFWFRYPFQRKKIDQFVVYKKKDLQQYNDNLYRDYMNNLDVYQQNQKMIPDLIDKIKQMQCQLSYILDQCGYSECDEF